ncbi:MAG: 2'-5' RNA ligase family protein [Parcubacteria group bacterium]
MENDFVRLNIAFIPPKDVADLAMRLSRKISQKSEAFFILDGNNFYPHITIYSPELPVGNLRKALKATDKLSAEFAPLQFKLSDIKNYMGWIGVHNQLTEEIKNIHAEVVDKINPLREDHLREKDIAQLQSLSEKEKNNLKLYGRTHLMNLYKPHLTIIRLKDKKPAEKIASEIEWPIKEFMLDKIGVFKTGRHGTCVELIKEFKLK